MTDRLLGKTAVVTGAGRGIGCAIATAFAREGASVCIADRDEAQAEAVVATLVESGAEAVAVAVDVRDEVRVSQMVETARESFRRLDILVNNAGINNTALLCEMETTQWQEIIDIDLTGVFLCTKAVLPQMIDQRWGRIINIGSQLAMKGAPTMVHYCAAKAGVHGFTRALAYEVAPFNITVNVIAPGPIETDALFAVPADWREKKRSEVPLNRFGRVEEIAPTAVLLASDEGAFYTGSTLNISGGDVMA
jgi:3-oxoacyl-[acyl-carrier protein] reductase